MKPVALLLLAVAPALAAEQTRTIPNPLNDLWPLEHVSFDFPAGQLSAPASVTVQGITRPAQIERVTVDGKPVDRVWTVVTIAAKDETGQPLPDPGKNPLLRSVTATFRPGAAESALSLKEEGEFYVITNGPYTARIRNYGKTPLAQPVSLDQLPHWLGGILVRGATNWDARARFEGNARIAEARTEVLTAGPVHIDLKVTLRGEQPAEDATVTAVPLLPGKQSFRFPPNEIPTEKVPKEAIRYEAVLRFVLDDPWIDVAERAHLPRDPEIKPWGFNQYLIEFGGKQGLRLDTVMWVRWFEWDKFGGNIELQFAPAAMREAQKGRPFAMLRPIWNQGGGGAQDFFLTSGGPTPKPGEAPNPATGYSPDNPAIGVVAAFPSKWVGPFAQTIVARAENGDSGSVRLPLVPAEAKGFFYGQRAYGLCAGPRELFDTTGRMNGLVRRHVDWTLNALINRNLLEWPRDPNRAGPNLLITRQRLEKLRKDFESGADTPEVRIMKSEWPKLEDDLRKIEELRAQLKTHEEGIRALPEDQRKAANDELVPLRDEIRQTEQRINSEGSAILRMIVQGTVKTPDLMISDLFRQRRYQDDFLNPTSPPVRKILQFRFADLFANGQPLGGAEQAALGYIVTDPDYWMGWRQGWMPGNPNFHTDKYAAALYLGGLLNDHPHSREWIEYARQNYLADLELTMLPPDGVGVECPGYSGYALALLLPMAKGFENLGMGNLLADQEMMKRTGLWHRNLLTPPDRRIGRRHEAPIGDTHRWDSGLGQGFGVLAAFYRQSDPAFASDMMSTWRMLEAAGVKADGTAASRALITMDYSIPETPLEKLDWSSRPWFGFGAILRSHFGTPEETFVSYKAGRIRGHYHNDENSFHYYADTTPIALDYNCSYTPRGDHAALHNSMTFGRTGEITNNATNKQVLAMEQLMTSAAVGAFVSTPEADVVISERKGKSLVNSPVYPEDAEFSREYPTRSVEEIIHRRGLMLVKHPAGSAFTDYLVVRDETQSQEPQQINLHLLARELALKDNRVDAVGQWDMDMAVFFAEAKDARMEDREWYYADEWMFGPEAYWIREGESFADWDKRLAAAAKSGDLPAKDFKPLQKNAQKGETKPWLDHIRKTQGRALIPPAGWKSRWTYGEYQKWLRVETAPGSPVLWVLYPYKKGSPAPQFEALPGGVRVTVAGQSEEIFFDTLTGASVVRDGKESVILAAGAVPELGKIKDEPLK